MSSREETTLRIEFVGKYHPEWHRKISVITVGGFRFNRCPYIGHEAVGGTHLYYVCERELTDGDRDSFWTAIRNKSEIVFHHSNWDRDHNQLQIKPGMTKPDLCKFLDVCASCGGTGCGLAMLPELV